MFGDRLRNARWRLKRKLRLWEERRTRDAPVRSPTRHHDLPGELVVSLTSYPPRFPTLLPTLKRLLSQSIAPDRTMLWLSWKDLEVLPADVRSLTKEGLEIRAADELGPHKKYFGARQSFPQAFILTVDDDIAYPRDTVAELVCAYRSDEKAVIARRARRLTFSDEAVGAIPKPICYWDWPIILGGSEKGDGLVPTGVGGVLYPPGAISDEALDAAAIRRLCRFSDDFWLFWMARRAGFTTRMAGRRTEHREWHGTHEVGLWQRNKAEGNEVWLALLHELGSPTNQVSCYTEHP